MADRHHICVLCSSSSRKVSGLTPTAVFMCYMHGACTYSGEPPGNQALHGWHGRHAQCSRPGSGKPQADASSECGPAKGTQHACHSGLLRKQPRIGAIAQLCETTCCLARQWACCIRHGSMPVGASRFTEGRATWRQRLAVIAGAANRHACPLRPGCAWVTHHTGNAHNNLDRMRARELEAWNFKHLELAVNFIELCALR
jgi:hypothetical protein